MQKIRNFKLHLRICIQMAHFAFFFFMSSGKVDEPHDHEVAGCGAMKIKERALLRTAKHIQMTGTLLHNMTPRDTAAQFTQGYNLEWDGSMQSYKLNKAKIWVPLSCLPMPTFL